MIVTVFLIIAAVIAGLATFVGVYPFGIESSRMSAICAAVCALCIALAFWHAGK